MSASLRSRNPRSLARYVISDRIFIPAPSPAPLVWRCRVYVVSHVVSVPLTRTLIRNILGTLSRCLRISPAHSLCRMHMRSLSL
jgi:hypothetical protein